MALSINDPEYSVAIGAYKGLYQGGDGVNDSLSFAAVGENFDISDGAISNKFAAEALPGDIMGRTIGTLASLYRRFFTPQSGSDEDQTLLVAAAGDKLYARAVNESIWQEIHTGYTNDDFDFVAYETSVYYIDKEAPGYPQRETRVAKYLYDTEEVPGTRYKEKTSASPIDILLITNADDGMWCIYGDTREVVYARVKPMGAEEETKFGIITRHAERIWGGRIASDPDLLMYSAPYDPFNWDANEEIPEDGAGDVRQPSWDGDSFLALRTMGSYLVALKKNRIWRIIGTDPSTYIFKEQYGGGTINENTVAVANDYMLMLGKDGIYIYDGTTTNSFRHHYVEKFMAGVNWNAIDKACAVMNSTVYMLSLPYGESLTNNVVLEYNIVEKTFTIRTIDARTFLSINGEIYFTSTEHPGRVLTLSKTECLPFLWESANQDLGAPGCKKSGFSFHITSDITMPISISVITEKKTKTKTVMLTGNKTKRVNVNVNGRRFKVRLQTDVHDRFTLLGNITISMDLEWD